MIIGFDGSRAFVPDRTGTENYSYQLLKALAGIDKKNKYVIYIRTGVVIRPWKIATPCTVRYMARNDGEGWPHNFQFKAINWPRLWTQAGLAIQTFQDNLDILFVPAHTLPIIRKPGLKTVVTVHDLGSEYLPSMHQIKQRLYLGFMQRFQLRTATKIIAVSEATKKDLVKRIGINADKIKVVYEGYDREKFKIQNVCKSKFCKQKPKFKSDTLVSSLSRFGLKPQEYFLFVGTIQPRKNLERLIKAFSFVIARGPAGSVSRRASSLTLFAAATRRDPSEPSPLATKPVHNISTDSEFVVPISLVIAGSKGWLSDEIYQLPKQLGIEDRVKFLGYVPEEDLPALYRGAVALTFPSLFEGFGLPILEAQASGCPVLTSNVSSMPEVAGKGAIYVDPYSIDDIVKGMIKVNNKDTNKLIKAGFENAESFSWEKCARETLEVLESV